MDGTSVEAAEAATEELSDSYHVRRWTCGDERGDVEGNVVVERIDDGRRSVGRRHSTINRRMVIEVVT